MDRATEQRVTTEPKVALHTETLETVATRQLTKLTTAVDTAKAALLKLQDTKGFWCFELEADCTIPAEYVLMQHFLDELDPALEQKIGVYLRERQCDDGGWPLYTGGKADISCSVKVYYALKLIGDDINAPHMQKARACILNLGGAAKSNVFTRITLALFEQVPWRAVPFIPVEMVLLPKWFFFHIMKVSYWSRTVMVPLLILCSLKPKAKNPRNIHINELFIIPAKKEKNYFPKRSALNRLFNLVDSICRRIVEPLIPKRMRRRALKIATNWFRERLNGEDGLGSIFPAMVNAYEALVIQGFPADHPDRQVAKQALEKLLVINEKQAYCQPCLSPIWDTALSCLALQEAEGGKTTPAVKQALDWLQTKQLLTQKGDWQFKRPNLAGGGWAFQFNNAYYPDLDDTAAVAWTMQQANQPGRYQNAINRAADWLAGMQSQNGGFGSFDVDNTHYYLNEIPFADHGALLDPPTSDVSGRCLTLFGLLQRPEDQAATAKVIQYLRDEQEIDGSWFGRWGTNYIYGTWSVLMAFEAAGISRDEPCIRKAVAWLERKQQADGGWGETNDSYFDQDLAGEGYPSCAFQTAWALLGLLAAGEVASTAVQRGVAFLLKAQNEAGLWQDPWFTAPGFPKVFYLKYHGYDKFFPLWALARYRNELREESISGGHPGI